MMKIEAYKKANLSITVSEEKEAEILSLLKGATMSDNKKKTPYMKYAFAACLLFLVCVSLVVFINIEKGRPRPIISTDVNEKTPTEQLFFNPGYILYKAENSKKTYYSNNYSEEINSLSFYELPDDITEALLLPPSPPFVSENNMFILKYSEDRLDFIIEEKKYTNSTDGSVVSVYAESKKNPLAQNENEWISSRVGSNNREVYIFEFDDEQTYIVLYEVGKVNSFYTIQCIDREKLRSILDLIF